MLQHSIYTFMKNRVIILFQREALIRNIAIIIIIDYYYWSLYVGGTKKDAKTSCADSVVEAMTAGRYDKGQGETSVAVSSTQRNSHPIVSSFYCIIIVANIVYLWAGVLLAWTTKGKDNKKLVNSVTVLTSLDFFFKEIFVSHYVMKYNLFNYCF